METNVKSRKTTIVNIALASGVILASVLRIVFGHLAGAWFQGEEFWDDALMARYSEIIAHFMLPNAASLLKYMAYPTFLCLVGMSNIPITIWIAVLWLIAGYLIYYVSRKLGLPKWIAFCLFVYLSFMPEAFEVWCGTRLYRNAIIGPFVAISLLLMIIMFFKFEQKSDKKKHCIAWAILTGLTTTFTYYIKEDGAWILACLLFAMFIWALRIIVQRRQLGRKEIITGVVSLTLPLFILLFATVLYKGINYRCFGVFETNTRTSGESGRFMSLVYTIDSENRTAEIWAPVDAIEKAFEASKTLEKHHELLENIKTSPWLYGDIYKNPIHGDFLGWVLYSAGLDSKIWTDDKGKEAFFKQVNNELEEAFKEGRLDKISNRVVLVSSGGSRTLSEIYDLKEEVYAGYKGAILYDGYEFGIEDCTANLSEDGTAVTELMIEKTGLDYLLDYSDVLPVINGTAKIAKIMSVIFSCVNVMLCILFFANIPIGVICIAKGRRTGLNLVKDNFSAMAKWLMSVAFAGIAFLYTFSIGWFSSFLHTGGIDKKFLNYYNVGLPVLLALSYLFAICCLYDMFIIRKSFKNEED